jgi:cytochrome c oxidase assembly protein Cox11
MAIFFFADGTIASATVIDRCTVKLQYSFFEINFKVGASNIGENTVKY